MKKVTTYENKKILVLGLAKSGVSAAKLLHKLGAFVTVNDFKEFSENPEAQDLLKKGIKVVTGSHPVELLDEGFSLIVKNPGIPYTNPIIEKAIQKGIPIITEVELAYEISEAPFVGITGTNGKTTTTTMIAEVLNQQGTKNQARLAGNIGYPASTVVQEASREDVLVTELSSFQLLGIQQFHPHVAVITNLYSAHLDYHETREAYVQAKWRIQKNMTAQDFLIYNADQEELSHLALTSDAKGVPFSAVKVVKDGAYQLEGKLYYKDTYIMESHDLGVPGTHNIENALATIAVGGIYEVAPEKIKYALCHFSGVPHRTQYIGEWQQRKFYNDSKATNILATEKALSGFEPGKVVLLAGGLDRGNNFDELVPSLKGIHTIVLFGETQKKLAEAAEKAKIPEILFTKNAESAVALAFEHSREGDSILLSPACASWDQYKNFEVRGDRFIAAYKKLKE